MRRLFAWTLAALLLASGPAAAQILPVATTYHPDTGGGIGAADNTTFTGANTFNGTSLFGGATTFGATVDFLQTSGVGVVKFWSTTAVGATWGSVKHDGTDFILSAGTGALRTALRVLATNAASNYFASGVSIDANSPLYLGGIETHPAVRVVTPNAPDIPSLVTNAGAANCWDVRRSTETATDLGNGLAVAGTATLPCLIVRANSTSTTEYNQVDLLGSHGGNSTTLTDDVATAFFHTPTINLGEAYVGTGDYAIKLLDAANEVQAVSGSFEWDAIRATTGGTVCSVRHLGHDGVLPGLPLKQLSSGTLDVATNGLTCAVVANVATFTMQANTSLTATSFVMVSQANVRLGPAAVIVD